jgi:hypothetical protein
MTLFLMALDCQYFAVPAAVKGYNQEFPDVYCWSVAKRLHPRAMVQTGLPACTACRAMPHLVHAFVAVISLVLFVGLAGAFTLGEMASAA